MNRSVGVGKKVGNANGHAYSSVISKTSTLKKALTAGSFWDDKDEFLDVIYWMRQVTALIVGVTWGFLPIKGILGLFLFFAINCAIVYVYFTKYQNIDEEDYGGPLEIIKEGLFTAFAVFLVSWIVIFTATQQKE